MSEILDKKTIKALSNDTRQEIVKMLAKRPHTASEISKTTRKHVTTITEHLEKLEQSDLVKKKDSTNKWVYYTLTDKGEHLFKPQFYSWVIVFSLSIVFIFVGFLRMFRFDAGAKMVADSANEQAPSAASQIANTTVSRAASPPIDYVSYVLIVIGIIGLAYLAYRKYRK